MREVCEVGLHVDAHSCVCVWVWVCVGVCVCVCTLAWGFPRLLVCLLACLPARFGACFALLCLGCLSLLAACFELLCVALSCFAFLCVALCCFALPCVCLPTCLRECFLLLAPLLLCVHPVCAYEPQLT